MREHSLLEGTLKELCERYQEMDTCSVNDIKEFILERL
jgi:hypothetical protein